MATTINQWFEEQSQRTPERIAISCGEDQLSYRQLSAISNTLAQHLLATNFGRESRIGICLNRSTDLVIGILGILKAGAAYVPLDHAYPVERLSYIVQDAGIETIICDNETRLCFIDSDIKLNLISLSEITRLSADSDATSLPVEISSEHAAYVIYTSGSTGQPKGCVVTHGNVVRLFSSTESLFEFNQTDVWTLFHSFAFDFSVWEIWGALFYGGRLVVVPSAVSRAPDEFLDLLIREEVTVLNQTPSAFLHLIEAESSRSHQTNSLRLRYIIFGGEGLDPRSLRNWVERHSIDHPQLINMYGITETTVHVTYRRITLDDIHRGGSPIGHPLADLQVYLLNAKGEPVAEGVPGEIYVGGAGLARGYLNRPELTAERFVTPPFDGCPSDRLYRSGDLARRNIDGSFEFLGRIDNQVKIRGHRIELGEIEAAIRQLEFVTQVAVIARDEGTVGKILVAYIVVQTGTKLDAAIMRQSLAVKLPPYMVPSFYVELETLPLTINGKLDVKALPLPQSHALQRERSIVRPRNPVEETIASAWISILNIQPISIDDNFFELGGHSLLAMRLVSIIGKQLNCNLLVKWVFENPTIQQLAQKLTEVKDNDGPLQSIPLIDRSQPIPLSFGQHAMWLVQALLPDAATYNQPIVIHLKGRIDRALVDHCIAQIARRHESLRTAFVQSGETLVQYICRPSEFDVNRREIGLPRLTAEQQKLALQAALIDEARRPFDLAVSPLWRVLWIPLNDEDQILVLTFHHSIIDEWSVRTFCHELSALYQSAGDPQAASLPELPIQYADYAVWQRARQTTAEWERSLVYWKDQLADLPPALELPADRIRPIQSDGQGAIHEFQMSAPLTNHLRQLARDESVTLFTLMLSAFNVWLARHTGQTDILVGTPVADRDRPEVQSLMGYFLNTLPIRTRLEGNPKFRRVLRQTHLTLLDAYSHAEIPFEHLVELAVKERGPGRHPIYQVMFILLEESVDELQLGDATGHLLWTTTGTSKNDLTLDIQANGDEWVCRMEYASDLFTQPLIERFAVHFQSLLEEITTNPEALIHSLPLMTEIETQQVLKDWNQTSVSFPAVRTIHEFFERQVELTPDSDAIVFNRDRLSYRQLNERANAIADRLINLGTQPDSLIGLFAERSLETMVGLLGILKAGAAYVPLDPSYPETRLRSIIQDAQIDVIVTQEHLAGQLIDGDFHRVLLGESGSGYSPVVENPPHAAGPNHLAYVLFTSGSTGRPKGVAMEHRALTNLIQWQIHQYPAGEHFRTLQFASLGFDVSFQEIFSTWCSGGTLVMIDENTRRDMSLFFKYIESEQLERIFVPFVVLQQFIEASEDYLQKKLSLREVVTAGEQLRITPQLVRFFENHPGCRLVNQYGPTEAHVVTSYRLEGSPLDWPLLPPIGRPIANIHVYVLDQHLQPLSIGMPGELYLSGVGVARGYLHQAELTAEKFVTDPFSNRAGSRLYRTGDKVRWNADGQLEFLGRIDQQVKFRGYRIELGEIEAVLNRAPQVAQTLVMLREDHPSEKRLVAYIVPTDATANPSTDDLRGFLQSQLPEYMVPSIFLVLPDLPLTVNGKVDRKALPVPNYEALSSGMRRHIAPRSPLEQLLANAWKTVLKIERVGVDDNFFELGGHSLLAMRLVSIVSKQLNRDVLVKWVFEYPTIQRLAQTLTGVNGDTRQLQSIPLVDRSQPLPLSFGQQGMWLVQALLPDSATYHQPIAIRLTGRINRTLVDHCIEQVSNRHESLRTAFVQSGETLVQHICEPAEFAVSRREISLRHETIGQQHQVLQSTILDEVRRPFDLAVAPLWRVLWVELADDDHVLVLTFHHSIIDEWSTQNFCRELSALYRTEGDFQAASLPELPIQYAEYAVWQRARQTTAEWEQSLAYWKEQLADLPPALELPSDRVRPIEPNGQGAIHEFRLSASLTSQLRQLACAESTTHFSLMLAAFHVWLARHTGQTDLIVGTPLADRERPEVQPLIGYFLNTLPIRARLDGSRNFRSVLRQVHQTFWDAYTHSEIPFEKLVELAVKEREPGRNPIYQVMFVLLEQAVEELQFGDTIGQPVWAATETSKNDLTLDIQTIGEEWICRLEYATDLFSDDVATRMAGHFVELLNSIVKDPDTQIGRLNIFDRDEKRQIIHGWNPLQTFSAANLSIHQLFEEQVLRTPKAIAVSYAGASLNYSQLNSLANRLACELIENQVEVESRVGICLERSLDLVVGILAILKAGAAYVPLDPRYPQDRLAYMIQDSEIKVLISDSTSTPLFANPPSPLSILCPSQDLSEIEFSSVDVSGDNAAYVIYTSGSTGQPKGCVVTHRNVVRLFQSTESLFGFNQSDVWTLFHSFAFDFSVWEIWGALFYGGRLVVVPYAISRSPDEFLNLLIHEEVTVLNQTPSAFRHLIEAENSRSERSESLRLRYVIFGGEGLDPRSLRAWVERHRIDRPQLINMYGITETTVHVTYRRITSNDVKRGGSPIGVPLADLQVYLLNPQGQPVPVGVPGEIYVGGAGLARGYLNRPELTATRFLTPSFDECPSDRLYRSGDLARRNEDGSLEFLGRIDSQVKIRGHRIELGEIESAILQIESVVRAAVVARDDGPVGKVLVAYIVPHPGAGLDAAGLRHALAMKLPSYMIPSFFVELETLPLTINGKLDTKALPFPQSASLDREQSIVLPRNPVEEMIASVWSTVLNIQTISIDDNFFELGGHSLLAVRVVDAIKSASGITIKVADLFRHATVAELAESLSETTRTPEDANRRHYLESIRPGSRDTHLVIVGAKLRVPLEMLPSDVPVWWLKLDGLHVWPPQYLDLPTQAAIHIQELLNEIPSGTILLCGHSYGGLLAIEIARQLTLVGKHAIKLILLEPTIPPDPDVSIIKRAAQKVRHYKKRIRLRLVQELAVGLHKRTVGKLNRMMIRARQSVDQKISPDDRWRYMEPFLFEHVRAYQLPDSIEHDVHLIKTEFYGPEDLDALNQIIKGAFSVYDASDSLDHLDIADARHSAVWMSIVQQLIAEQSNLPAV